MIKTKYNKGGNNNEVNLKAKRPKRNSESQIVFEETMEMRLDRCVQKVKDLSELVIGYTPYELNFAIKTYSGVTNKPSKVSAFANAVVGIILADGQSSFSHIGNVLGLDVDMDQAIVIEEKLFGSCFETEDQKAGMGNFLEKDKEKKLKVVPFQNK